MLYIHQIQQVDSRKYLALKFEKGQRYKLNSFLNNVCGLFDNKVFVLR